MSWEKDRVRRVVTEKSWKPKWKNCDRRKHRLSCWQPQETAIVTLTLAECQPLLEPLESGTARLFALKGAKSFVRGPLLRLLQQAQVRTLISQPPLPHEPLAPLRHLLECWGQKWPEIEWSGQFLWSFWLGQSVAQSYYWSLVASRLRECPTVVWLAFEDLQTPVWRRFLQVVRQGQFKVPVSFVYLHPEDELLEPGILALEASQWVEKSKSRELDEGELLAPLSKHARALLGQALVLGDSWTPAALKKVSRADLPRRKTELRKAGVLDEKGHFQKQRLRAASPLPPPTSNVWKQRALKRLHSSQAQLHKRMTRLWLAERASSLLQTSPGSFAQGLLMLPVSPLASKVVQDHNVSGELRCLAALVLRQTPGETAPSLAEMNLPSPWYELYQSLQPAPSAGDWSDRQAELQSRLLQKGATEAAGWLACSQVRWLLDFGRYQTTFTLLAPFQESQHWAQRWWMACLKAEAFEQMNRQDLARNQLMQATKALPQPPPPVLTAELRWASLRALMREGHSLEGNLQAHLSRETLLAFGDGPRLGRFLLLAAEAEWGRQQFDDARNLLGRALDLFRRYEHTSGILETQIKLGLVLKKKPLPRFVG